jgi:integrase/recombinase XerD
VCSFFAWLDQHRIGGLADIEPLHVAAYVKGLEGTASKPTVKQHLAAIRMLFDWLIVGQILAINPAHAVRGPKHVVKRGKTPVLDEDQARRVLAGLDMRMWGFPVCWATLATPGEGERRLSLRL